VIGCTPPKEETREGQFLLLEILKVLKVTGADFVTPENHSSSLSSSMVSILTGLGFTTAL
jgi:hypothetical protein